MEHLVGIPQIPWASHPVDIPWVSHGHPIRDPIGIRIDPCVPTPFKYLHYLLNILGFSRCPKEFFTIGIPWTSHGHLMGIP